MKIRLSEDEVYEIKMPEEIGVEEFQSVVTKFNFLLKNFAKFNIGDDLGKGDIVLSGSQIKRTYKRKSDDYNFIKENRDVFVEILKAHYFKSKEEFFELMERHNLNFTKPELCSTKMLIIRDELLKVNPREVGLIKFPTRHEQIVNLKLPQSELIKLGIGGEEE